MTKAARKKFLSQATGKPGGSLPYSLPGHWAWEGRDRMNSLPRKSQELEPAGPERRRDPSPTGMS